MVSTDGLYLDLLFWCCRLILLVFFFIQGFISIFFSMQKVAYLFGGESYNEIICSKVIDCGAA
jgi:hypothetical protein